MAGRGRRLTSGPLRKERGLGMRESVASSGEGLAMRGEGGRFLSSARVEGEGSREGRLGDFAVAVPSSSSSGMERLMRGGGEAGPSSRGCSGGKKGANAKERLGG